MSAIEMSCRIERLSSERDRVIVRISGQISGRYVALLRGVLEQERATVVIDLKEVLLVDREAVELLATSVNNGSELKNGAAYILEWVTRERAQIAEDWKLRGTDIEEDI